MNNFEGKINYEFIKEDAEKIYDSLFLDKEDLNKPSKVCSYDFIQKIHDEFVKEQNEINDKY